VMGRVRARTPKRLRRRGRGPLPYLTVMPSKNADSVFLTRIPQHPSMRREYFPNAKGNVLIE
jgi:hypothetical protein